MAQFHAYQCHFSITDFHLESFLSATLLQALRFSVKTILNGGAFIKSEAKQALKAELVLCVSLQTQYRGSSSQYWLYQSSKPQRDRQTRGRTETSGDRVQTKNSCLSSLQHKIYSNTDLRLAVINHCESPIILSDGRVKLGDVHTHTHTRG